MESTNDLCREVAGSCVCFNLRKATRLVTQLYDGVLRPSGLRTTQFTVLVAVSLSDSVPMSTLADLLGMDRTTLTRNLKSLRELGLVASAAGDDRRSRLISLTESGRTALESALPLWREAQRRATELLGEDRAGQLTPILAEVSSLVTETHMEVRT
ncbi:MAG TPA: MarR family winged helix-turn-helix transcriptional regulator [Actinomycetota bacterium]|nr:MarR family winged helix-turn-helix transcriptional regulator [Actinomycetota bacterium]